MKKQILVLFLAVLMIFSAFTACSDDEFAAMIIFSNPTKTEYVVGETFDFTGASVEVTMKDGTTKIIQVTKEMLSEIPVFMSAGQKKIAVTYTEGDVTLTAYITVTVTGALFGLDNVKTAAKEALNATFNRICWKAPADYPTLPEFWGEDYFYAPAKAILDKAMADIDAASDEKTVGAIAGKASTELTMLNNYVNYYVDVKADEIIALVEEKYAGNEELYGQDFENAMVLAEATIRLMEKTELLDVVDSMFEEWQADDAENKTVVQKIAEEMLKMEWPIDIPETAAGDDADVTIQSFWKIIEYMQSAMERAAVNEQFAQQLAAALSAYDLANLEGLNTESALYEEVFLPHIAEGPEGEQLLNIYSVTGYEAEGALVDIMMRIQQLADARFEANVSVKLYDFVYAVYNGDLLSRADYAERIKDLDDLQKAAVQEQIVADYIAKGILPAGATFADLTFIDARLVVGEAGEGGWILVPTATVGADSIDAEIENVLTAVGKTGDAYNPVIYGSTLSDRIYALVDAIGAWGDRYEIDEINEDLLDKLADLETVWEALEKIEAALNDPELPSLELPAQIILGTSNTAVEAQRTIADEYAAEMEIPVTAQWENDQGVVDYVIPNYSRLLLAEARLAELAAAKENAGTVIDMIQAIPDLIIYAQYTEVDAAESVLLDLMEEYNLYLGYNPYAPDATVVVPPVDPDAATEATVIANLKEILGEDVYNKMMNALARVDELEAAAAASADLKAAIDAIGDVTLDSMDETTGTLYAAKQLYDAWVDQFNIDDTNAYEILGFDEEQNSRYDVYQAALVYYADLQTKLQALKEKIDALPNDLAAATSQRTAIEEARELFKELCELNNDSYFDEEGNLNYFDDDGEFITPTTDHSVTYKHLTKTVEGDLYEKLVVLEAAIFAGDANGFVNGLVGDAKALYDQYFAAINGEIREQDGANLLAAYSEIIAEINWIHENILTKDIFANAVMTGILPVDFQTKLFDEIGAMFEESIEPMFQEAVRYIITGDATSGYDVVIYAADTYNGATMQAADAVGTIVSNFKTVTIKVDGVVLEGITADTVVYDIPVEETTISTFEGLTEGYIALKNCNITNIVINGTRPVYISIDGDENTIGTVTAAKASYVDIEAYGELLGSIKVVLGDAETDVQMQVVANEAEYIYIDAEGYVEVYANDVDIAISVATDAKDTIVPEVYVAPTTEAYVTGQIVSNDMLSENSTEADEYLGVEINMDLTDFPFDVDVTPTPPTGGSWSPIV